MLQLGRLLIALFVVVAALTAQVSAADPPKVELNKQPGQVEITVGGKPFATYVYADPKISRPYFAHVHAPNGTQVTRNHPPIAGKDKMDHPEFHPGIWMAFGDIEGNDYWRLKAPVEHSRFYPDRANDTFSVLNRYLAANDPSDLICEEVCHFRIAPTPFGIMLLWDSTFLGVHKFTFGDQEEMGLGVRVATPMRVEAGDGSIPPGTGTMTDAKGRKNGAEIGGNDSDWCDYSGTIDGQRVGITIFCHPDNFRPSWFHARDYGFFAANAFGRAAFKKGPPSKVDVLSDDEFQLRYGVLVHSSADGKQPDLNAAFEYYKRLAGFENLRALE